MRIRSASPKRLVFDTHRMLLFDSSFLPGDMQSIYFFERESQDVWCYYNIVRTSKNASPLTAGNEASAINRTVAFYRYLGGENPCGG
jgi:hypothetical protein